MTRYVCGDSNARLFSLCADRVIEFGGMTFHAVGQFGPPELNLSPGDLVLYVFGEVDSRVHILKIAQQSGDTVEQTIVKLLNAYVEKVANYCGTRGAIPFICACPPPAEKTTPEAVVPVLDSLAERCAREKLINEHLRRICAEHGIHVIDPWGPYRNPDGSLNMALSDGIVHVRDEERGTVRDAVMPHFSPPT